MARFGAALSLPRPLAAICLALFLTSAAWSQIASIDDTTSTPIEGAGHDYIKMLSETVNPANGSVSLRIQVPIPKGRGITIPFSFTYDSNSVYHLLPDTYPNYGQVNWASNTGYLSQGGWSYSVPEASYAYTALVGGSYGNFYTCNTYTNYMFRDVTGGQHELGSLATTWSINGPCGGPVVSGGGDQQVYATIPATDGNPNNYDPLKIFTADGTVYQFPQNSGVTGVNQQYYWLPTSIEDRNGNKVVVNDNGQGTFSFIDSVGRTAISSNGFGPSGTTNTLSFSGSTYQVTWTSITPTGFTTPSTWAGPPTEPNDYDVCLPPPAAPKNTQTVVSQIKLPNGKYYQFHYDPTYGTLSEIDYPSGAWVKYTWKLSDTMNELANYPGWYNMGENACPSDGYTACPGPVPNGCLYQYKSPVVATRQVGFGGSTPSLTQTFTYQTLWESSPNANIWTSKTTSVYATDPVLGQSLTSYSYVGAPTLYFPTCTTGLCAQMPVESSVKYFDWGNTTTPLQTVNKTWYDVFDIASEQTVLTTGPQAGQSSATTYCYPGTNCTPPYAPYTFQQLKEKDEYDYGATTASRKTVTTYQSYTGTPGYIADDPCRIVVYDGSGNPYSETDYYYDGGTSLCASGTPSVTGVSGLVSGTHDETNFGPSSTIPRGNLTQEVKSASIGTSPATTYTYDETGRVLSSTDPCGNGSCSDVTGSSHTTTYGYADNYTILSGGANVSYPPPNGTTDGYLTSITDPLGHVWQFTYDYNNGQLTAATDVSNSGIATNYLYNDLFSRPTLVTFPDGGSTTIAYNDAAYNPTYNPTTASPSVTTTTKISSTLNKTSTTAFDGVGHAVATMFTSDPDGTTYTATSYYGTGKPYKVWNPTRCNPPTTNCSETTWGFTQYLYDGMGRTKQVTKPDLSIALTSYSGNETTVTDEVGNQRTSQTDGLGRLTNVWEAPNSSGYDYLTTYIYDPLNNLSSVTQNGSNSSYARNRSFVYDSLARLTSATNPESGTITYSYDLNGNVTSKVTPKPDQTGSGHTTIAYSYDADNRLTAKTYTNPTSTTVQYGYDGNTLSSCGQNPPIITSPTYLVGRRSAMCSGLSGSSWSFDKMGRPLLETTITNGGGNQTKLSVGYTYNLDGSLNTLTYPSGDVLTYAQGGAGRLLGVSDSNNTYVASGTSNRAVYAPSGGLTSMTNGYSSGFVGLVTTNAYNDRLQPILLSAAVSGGSSIFSLCYDFHLGAAINTVGCPPISAYNPPADNGNIFQITNTLYPTRSSAYVYDPLNRIAQAYTVNPSSPDCWGETFATAATAPGVVPPPSISGIDAWGNLINRSGVSGMAPSCHTEGLSATANTQNQLSVLTYDAAGNVTNDGNGNQPTYDDENRIATDAGVTYSYDANGMRVEKSSGTKYWYGAGQVLSESSLTGTINEEYVYFNGERIARVDRPSGTVNYYFSNHLGSASVITSATGLIQEQYDYYPFGGIAYSSGSDPNHYKFTGKERDSESNLDNFGARYFASSLGRFMTPDWAARATAVPYAIFGDPQTLNLYTYVRNDPVSAADADGHASCADPHGCDVLSDPNVQGQNQGTKPLDGAQTVTKPTVVTNADGTTTVTQKSSSSSSTKDSNGNVTVSTTSTTTVQTLNAHGDIQQTTSYSSTYTITVDSKGNVATSTTNSQTSVDSNSSLAQGLRSNGISWTQMKLTDFVSMPTAAKAISDRIGITVGDVFDGVKAFGEETSKASYQCAKAGTDCY